MANEKQMHHELKNKLKFPDYYGCNFDALYDCLTDISNNEIIIIHNFIYAFKSLNKISVSMIEVFYSAKMNTGNFHFLVIDDEIFNYIGMLSLQDLFMLRTDHLR